jgi:ribosomal protein S18 acetylase RimI-like enzyme
MSFKIVPFSSNHTRECFNCGTPELDRYLKQYASQDARRNLATIFVAVKDNETQVFGYYTLSNTSVNVLIIPESSKKKLSKYNEIPAIRLGRLAVDKSVQGQGLGAKLLANAVIRSVSNVSAWALMVVDAKDNAASLFYKKFGFQPLLDDERHLYASRQTLEENLRSILG